MPPTLECIDHIHVYVANREAAEKWYADILGLMRIPELEFWAEDDGGPLTIGNAAGTVHLALFQRAASPCRSVIAFGVNASEFLAWHTHLSKQFEQAIEIFDHEVSWSFYFSDPDSNPYEITSHQYAAIAARL